MKENDGKLFSAIYFVNKMCCICFLSGFIVAWGKPEVYIPSIYFIVQYKIFTLERHNPNFK